MGKNEIARWDKHLSNERKELGIETFRGQNERGSFKIESDTGKCKICGKEKTDFTPAGIRHHICNDCKALPTEISSE